MNPQEIILGLFTCCLALATSALIFAALWLTERRRRRHWQERAELREHDMREAMEAGQRNPRLPGLD